jgi:disulfide bond formation protein DsbB
VVRTARLERTPASAIARKPAKPLSLFGLFGAAVRLVASAIFALTLYVGVVQLGHHAAISLPGSHLEVALPILIFAALIALLVLPLFAGWEQNVRQFSLLMAIWLLVIVVAHTTGILGFDPTRLPSWFNMGMFGLRPD